MAFEIVEFDRTREVDYVPRIWLCNLDEIDIGQKIKDKAIMECSWPLGYILKTFQEQRIWEWNQMKTGQNMLPV